MVGFGEVDVPKKVKLLFLPKVLYNVGQKSYDCMIPYIQRLNRSRTSFLTNLETVSYTHLTLPTTPYV